VRLLWEKIKLSLLVTVFDKTENNKAWTCLKADTVNLGLNTTKAIFPATFFAKDDDRMAREAAEYTLYAATYLATLQKVET